MDERRFLFEGIDVPDIDRLAVYREHGGDAGLRRARSLTPDAVVDEVVAAGLRGRGGAWRRVGERWRVARQAGGAAHLVVDLLEPEPGRFRDRKLAERQPHRLLEGIGIAAHAVGAHSAWICIAAGAARARATLAAAIDERRAEAGVRVVLHPVPGPLPLAAGDTLCLELVQGGRPEPRAADDGEPPASLFGEAAVVHTASTLGFLPALLTAGADAFVRLGSSFAPGTQAFCISGLVRRPGLYEVELDPRATVADLVEDLAGGVRAGHQLKFVLHDGYGSDPVLLPADLERPLDPGAWAHPGGGDLPGAFGAGAILVADDTVCTVDTAHRLLSAAAGTACGKCLPCREGTAWLAAALQRLEAGAADAAAAERIDIRCAALAEAPALCAHGPRAARAVAGLRSAFADEFDAHRGAGSCPVTKDLAMKVPDSIHVRY